MAAILVRFHMCKPSKHAFRWPGSRYRQVINKHNIDNISFSLFEVFGPQGNVTAISKVYRKISDIRCTKSPNLIVSRLVMQLYVPNRMKPGVLSRMKM